MWQVIAVPAVANVVALIDDIELSHSSSLLLCCVKCIVAFDTNVARDVVVYVCACVLARVLALINSAGCCNMLSFGLLLLLFLKYDCYGVVVVNVASNFVATCVRCFVVVSKEKNYTRRNGCSCCFCCFMKTAILHAHKFRTILQECVKLLVRARGQVPFDVNELTKQSLNVGKSVFGRDTFHTA